LVSELKEKNGLRVYENRLLRRIFGLKMEEVAGGWRRLHNEELRNVLVYTSPKFIGEIISRRMRWLGHIAHVRDVKFADNFIRKT
jgi:hypothetical protein